MSSVDSTARPTSRTLSISSARSRSASYRRTLSTATAAWAASVIASCSSSSVNGAPPALSVR